MEMCEGGDLDRHLKSHGHLPEKEARAITAQVRGEMEGGQKWVSRHR